MAARPASKTGAGFRWRNFPTIKGLADLVVLVDAVGDPVVPVALAVVDVVPAVPVDAVPVALADVVLVDPADVAVTDATIATRPATCTRT